MATTDMIRFENVKKIYTGLDAKSKDIVALHNVNLSIKKGEFVFVLGHSGAGKSTFLKLILREEAATEGKVFVNGRDLSSIRQREIPYLRRGLGVVFQDYAVWPHMTVLENVCYPMKKRRMSKAEIKQKAENALKGLEILEKEEIHLVLLDIMMPGMNGLEMCKKIRETNNIPIIMLSAKSTDLDKILGLGTGADDYVVKPFNPLELTARVKSQLRRYTQLNPNRNTGQAAKNEINIKGLSINKDNHKVVVYGEEIKLTPIEFDILYLLASNPGRVFSTDEIFEKVWNEKVYEANNTVMVHIRRLRGKMKEDTRQDKIITTVWGVGYKIEK